MGRIAEIPHCPVHIPAHSTVHTYCTAPVRCFGPPSYLPGVRQHLHRTGSIQIGNNAPFFARGISIHQGITNRAKNTRLLFYNPDFFRDRIELAVRLFRVVARHKYLDLAEGLGTLTCAKRRAVAVLRAVFARAASIKQVRNRTACASFVSWRREEHPRQPAFITCPVCPG